MMAFVAIFAVGLVLGAVIGSYALWKRIMKNRRHYGHSGSRSHRAPRRRGLMSWGRTIFALSAVPRNRTENNSINRDWLGAQIYAPACILTVNGRLLSAISRHSR